MPYTRPSIVKGHLSQVLSTWDHKTLSVDEERKGFPPPGVSENSGARTRIPPNKLGNLPENGLCQALSAAPGPLQRATERTQRDGALLITGAERENRRADPEVGRARERNERLKSSESILRVGRTLKGENLIRGKRAAAPARGPRASPAAARLFPAHRPICSITQSPEAI